MTTFLFWNMDGQDRRDVLVRLVERHHVDVLLLAECPLPSSHLLEALSRVEGSRFHENPGTNERIMICSRASPEQVREIHAGPRFTIRHLRLPGKTDILLAAAHLESKLHQSRDSQTYTCLNFVDAIGASELDMGHRRSVVVGDLNMNPFEPAMIAARGFHAVMDRKIAEKGSRTVQGTEYRYFYNPMWSLLGDASPGPPGTYYRSSGEHVTYFWHMMDQVLLRPELLARFRNEDLEILTNDGETSFLKPTGIDKKAASDHLPLLFRLAL